MVEPFVSDPDFTLYIGDVIEVLTDLSADSVEAVVTSPPYLDARPEYGAVDHGQWNVIFGQLRRVVTGPALFNVGRLWRNHAENLWWMALIEAATIAGWKHLDTRVWIKPNANPIHGRLFADRHEYVLIFGSHDTRFNLDAIRVPYAASSVPRLKRGWTNHTGVKNDTGRKNGRRSSEPHELGGRAPSYFDCYTGAEKGNPHPAPMPLGVAEELVKLASWPGQVVLDPFAGSGTTAIAARRLGRRSIGIELNQAYGLLAAKRLSQQSLLAEEVG